MTKTPLSKKLEHWHRELSQVAVSINRALVKRAMRPGATAEWARELELVARQMRETEDVGRSRIDPGGSPTDRGERQAERHS